MNEPAERRTRLATCPVDGTPLIMTMAFRGAEFYCLECGGRFGWLQPHGVEPTPELEERYEKLKAEWDEHAGGKLLAAGAWREDCAQCNSEHPHAEHATEAELTAHRGALAWLDARSTRSVA
jgi:hypothetical protein